MKQTRILVAVALLAALGACKKSEPAKATADAAPAKVAPVAAPDAAAAEKPTPAPASDKIKPFFYAIEKDGKKSYILGSMHMGVDPARLPDNVYAALAAAKTFAMEADISDPGSLKDLMLPEGQTLDQIIGPDYWKKLSDEVGTALAEGMKGFKPSGAAALLEMSGLPMTMPMDVVLIGKARDQGATLVYLEEAALQQRVLDKWLDATALKEMIDDLEKNKVKQKELLVAYQAGDEAKMIELNFDKSDWKRSPEEYDAMMKDMLYDRNASWIPKLSEMFDAGDAFVVVGAAHLLGDGSVLDLLRKKGYSVTRVES